MQPDYLGWKVMWTTVHRDQNIYKTGFCTKQLKYSSPKAVLTLYFAIFSSNQKKQS